MKKHPSELSFEKGETEVGTGPMNLIVAAAGECNLSCFMCGQSIVEKLPVTLDSDHLLDYLKDAESLTITGGEPLWVSGDINRASGSLLQNVAEKFPHVKISAFTNGLYLPEKIAESVVENFQWVSFSIDTLDPAVFKKIRGKDVLPKVLENLDRLIMHKEKKGLGKNDAPLICINTLICKSTVEGVVELSEYLSKRGVHVQNLVKLRNVLGHEYLDEIEKLPDEEKTNTIQDEIAEEIIEPGELEPEVVNETVEQLTALCKKTGFDMNDLSGIYAKKEGPSGKLKPSERTCPYPWTNVEIHSNGDVYCCCVNTVILGNINRDSFEEIWNGEATKSLRHAFLNGEMRGCIQESCGANVDYFSNINAYSEDFFQNLLREKGNGIKSILLLRTAPLYQSRITAATLQKRFPNAKLTIVSNRAGTRACKEWNDDWRVMEYPGISFEPDVFGDWWKSGKHGMYDLAIAPYNTNSSGDCSNINQTLSLMEADLKFMISNDGQLEKL